jgi:hypothetical protein
MKRLFPFLQVVYLQLTDNSRVGKCGTIVSFHYRERDVLMAPNLLLYQLLLVALVLICLLIHVEWAQQS